MKEHRVRALRVTTTTSIKSQEEDGSLQLLRLELELRCDSACSRVGHHHHHHRSTDQKGVTSVLQECPAYSNVLTIDDFVKKPSDEFGICKFKMRNSNNGFTKARNLSSDTFNRVYETLVAGGAGICLQQLLALSDEKASLLLLSTCRRLIRDAAFPLALRVVRMAVELGCDLDAVDGEGRTLLSHSVSFLDDTSELTRELLHAGASVWDDACMSAPFAWFLRAVMRRRRLDGRGARTLWLLSEAMGEEPSRMHALVMRTMFRHARCYKIMGPVFLQLKSSMKRYWTQPLDLKFMCRKTIRSAVGAERLVAGGVTQLGLPSKLQRYICLE